MIFFISHAKFQPCSTVLHKQELSNDICIKFQFSPSTEIINLAKQFQKFDTFYMYNANNVFQFDTFVTCICKKLLTDAQT